MKLQVIEPKKTKFANVFSRIKKNLADGVYDECLIITRIGNDIEVTPLVETDYAYMNLLLWNVFIDNVKRGFPDEP